MSATATLNRCHARGAAIADRYRRAGADLPFTDPARDHGSPFEGYYWRFTDQERRRVVVALCGLSAVPSARWALLALAVYPGALVRSAIIPAAVADRRNLRIRAGDAFEASRRTVRVALDAETALDVEVDRPRRWGRRSLGGSGPAHALPGLAQYWHPHLLGGAASGEVRLGGERFRLDGAHVYAEKNWGTAFPQRWWWGQADCFDDADACVAFAGGPIRVGRVAMRATAVAVRLGTRLLSLSPPLALTLADIGRDEWRIRGRSARHTVDIEGRDRGSSIVLPVPASDRPASEPRSQQALAGDLRLLVRRGRRTLFRGDSPLAGLERQREPGSCA